MKIKQWLYLQNPNSVLRGYEPRFTLDAENNNELTSEYGWVPLEQIELDVTIDQNKVVSAALAGLDAEEELVRNELKAKLKRIESKRRDLQAITYQEAG